VTNQKSN